MRTPPGVVCLKLKALKFFAAICMIAVRIEENNDLKCEMKF